MKSQAYVSKRRITNICCLVVSLGLVKVVFGAYLMAGGTLFSFENKKQAVDPKMEALAKVREKQLLAMKKMQNELVVDKGASLQALSSHTSSAKGQIADNNTNIAKTQEVQTVQEHKPSMQVVQVAENTATDDMLVKASMATIGSMRTKARHSVMENAFKGEENEHLLDGMAQEPSYKKEKSRSLFSFVGTAHAEEVDPSKYARPDQKAVNTEIPAPNVANPYDSPNVLSYKESELNQKEEELLSLQEQMNARMQELNKLENKLGNMVKEANSVESDKYSHLIQTYSAMKPRKAAEALSTLDEKIAVRILTGMKSKQSGEIFSYMDPVQAARLSKAMTKMNAF